MCLPLVSGSFCFVFFLLCVLYERLNKGTWSETIGSHRLGRTHGLELQHQDICCVTGVRGRGRRHVLVGAWGMG